MHTHFLDPYRHGHSPVHKLDARVKLVLALAFILTTALTPVGIWPIYMLLFAIVLSVEILSEIGLRYALKRASLAFPFMLAAVPLLFAVEGPSIFDVSLGPIAFSISQSGLERFATIAAKSWISVQMAIVLAATTLFPDLLMAMRALRVPRLLVNIFGLMWRYLFLLADEAMRLMRARSSRSGQLAGGSRPGGTLVWRAKVTGGMAGNLFLRSFERGERIHSAMTARGYNGEMRSLAQPRMQAWEWVLLFAGLVLLGLLLALAFLLWV